MLMVRFVAACLSCSVLVRAGTSSWFQSGLGDLPVLYDMYSECNSGNTDKDLEECVYANAVVTLDDAVKTNEIPIDNGMVLKRRAPLNGVEDAGRLSVQELEDSLPRNDDSKGDQLFWMMLNKFSQLLKTHKLETGEGRQHAKLKKAMLPFIMGIVLKFATFVPLVLTGMILLAMKSLLLSKLALLSMVFMGVQHFLPKAVPQHDQESQFGASHLHPDFAKYSHILMGGGDHDGFEEAASNAFPQTVPLPAGGSYHRRYVTLGRSLEENLQDSKSSSSSNS